MEIVCWSVSGATNVNLVTTKTGGLVGMLPDVGLWLLR